MLYNIDNQPIAFPYLAHSTPHGSELPLEARAKKVSTEMCIIICIMLIIAL